MTFGHMQPYYLPPVTTIALDVTRSLPLSLKNCSNTLLHIFVNSLLRKYGWCPRSTTAKMQRSDWTAYVSGVQVPVCAAAGPARGPDQLQGGGEEDPG
jgi:hypothetical protein